MTPDKPVVMIEVKGAYRAGKSTLAHLIRGMLRQQDIPCEGPDKLPVFDVGAAVHGLKRRGLSVVIVETETGERTQIDCRRKAARPGA